jgi:hypothetical protein
VAAARAFHCIAADFGIDETQLEIVIVNAFNGVVTFDELRDTRCLNCQPW